MLSEELKPLNYSQSSQTVNSYSLQTINMSLKKKKKTKFILYYHFNEAEEHSINAQYWFIDI